MFARFEVLVNIEKAEDYCVSGRGFMLLYDVPDPRHAVP